MRHLLHRFVCLGFGFFIPFALIPASFATEPFPAVHREGKLEFNLEPLTCAHYIREPQARHPHLAFKVGGEVGRELQGPAHPGFFRIAVGRGSKADSSGPIPPRIECDLSAVSPEAKTLKIVEGGVELVIPALHPDAIAVITNVPAHTARRSTRKPCARRASRWRSSTAAPTTRG